MLNLIRKHQPISRADLARRSHLQRSTVSAIIEQLIGERWVTTGACEDLPRGRKPTFLHLNGNRAGVIGIDVRPKETTIALANLEMRFLTQGSIMTNPDPTQLIKQLGERLEHLMNSYPHITIEGIGVVLPGRVELPSNRLTCDPNLGWGPVDFKKLLEEATGLPVELENVANACALAEFWMGAQRDNVRNLVAVTVSEDIGIGMIFNGQLVRGAMGMAGEFGHIKIQEDGPLCRCGNRGCFEACASNPVAVRHFSEVMGNKSGKKSSREVDFDSIL
ncbi:MAG TPA: ROK family transcriptional regulator, partial [Phycisphaerae bacterium]